MIRILVVDDSVFMRRIISDIINDESGLEVVAVAKNGSEALRMIDELNPDVMVMDIEMPIMNGVEALKKIMSFNPVIPVIMVSGLDNKKTVIEALELGAFDFIAKPSGTLSFDMKKISDELISRIKSAHKAYLRKRKCLKEKKKDNGFPVIALGCSSGGPKALKKILPMFPADLSAALVIVQHMPAKFTASLAERLNYDSEITIKEAADNDYLQPGLGLIAPGGYHLEITQRGRVSLNKNPTKWGVRPCVDYMMSSIAKIYKESVIGVILTGMGHDGAKGMIDIKKHNGYGIVENKETALVYGMPGSVIKANAYDEVLPLQEIPLRVIELVKKMS
ncbi:MAG: protein-glutamate methylesterase/protein-glutamine glutaminase [bacterium]